MPRDRASRLAPVLLGVATVLAASAAAAAPPQPTQPCTHEAVVAARRQLAADLKQQQFARGYQQLGQLKQSCRLRPTQGPTDRPNLDYFWYHGELALAAHRAGDHLGCLRVLSLITSLKERDSIHGLQLADQPVGKAILHNETLCQQAYDAGFRDFRADACALKHDGATAVGVPASALPTGARLVGCLVLTHGAAGPAFRQALGEGTPDAGKLCPRLDLLTSGAAAKRVTLLGGDRLADVSSCCNLDRLSVAVRGGKRLVRVQGSGRECFGGTADSSTDDLYEWRGDQLVRVQQGGLVYH